ncbi:MAG TPA: KUP/HAK/KT family potassium transporter, partial [Caulobacteraceae bacterium]|nr:KUP/HAK/KT family potassium transporter [Caulobacteraceae bacterium]
MAGDTPGATDSSPSPAPDKAPASADPAASGADVQKHGMLGPHGEAAGRDAHAGQGFFALALGSVGVVFGDIGTSPLYALRQTFAGAHQLPIDQVQVYGVLSLIFWSMMLVVSFKYITILTRADNKGEGGSLALLALISRKGKFRWSAGIVLLGVFACALFYGDSMITPAISVLS